MNKSIKIVAVLVVLIVIATATIYVTSSKDGEKRTIVETGRLMVYGNANNDDYIDSYDVDFIQEIIDGKKTWDKSGYPYADTNCDGKIDQSDIDQLKRFINKESGTMYYTDSWNGVSSISYPMTGTIGTMYWEAAELAVLLGLWDRVTACAYGSLSDLKNPGWEQKYSYGKGPMIDPELIFDSKVDSVIAYNGDDGSAAQIKEAIASTSSKVNLVALPSDFTSRVATAGVLYGCEDRYIEYLQGLDEADSYVADKLKEVSSEDAPKVVTIMVNTASELGNIRILTNAGAGAHGLYKIFAQTPAAMPVPPPGNKYFISVDIEWILEQDPDYIVWVSSGAWDNNGTESEIREKFNYWNDTLFSSTRAYKEGHIIATANGTMGGFAANYAALPILANVFHELDKDFAYSFYDSYSEKGFRYFTLDQLPAFKIYTMTDA